MIRRNLFALLALAAACGLAQAQPTSTGSGQAYPAKPIRVIVPSTPGGGTDFIGRLISTKLNELNGWTVVPDNKPGAGTALGLAEAARSRNDGYELVVAQTDNVSLIPLLLKVAYDPVRDLTPVALVATTPMVLIVPASSPFRTLGDLIKAAKAAPGSISYGTSGTGGAVHIALEMLQYDAGIKLQHVPYKGSSPALVDLVGGHLQFAGSSISSAASLLNAGKIRALAVTSPRRNPSLPDVPTVAESGYKDFSMVSYYGIMAPAGLPQSIVTRLNTDINKILQRPDVRTALLGQGLDPSPASPEEFGALIKADIAKSKAVITNANIRVEQ
ncbi:Bug family tripartite tricarboxylate transporter substrate binding protein [Caenimonas terrae]|uniref:Bug family tripartite tricarboxylate transporter substrate binding protein n=1 Tax=Caenimonas terrae TaxID=696074 RepID=A0ABW0NML8_9BURK